MPYMLPWERTAEKRGKRKGKERRKDEKVYTGNHFLFIIHPVDPR